MKERPIIFDGESVRAILAGTKTQTRRVVKDAPLNCPSASTVAFTVASTKADERGSFVIRESSEDGPVFTDRGRERVLWRGRCPFGKPGDLLWVRETWSRYYTGVDRLYHYRADLPDDWDGAITADHSFGLHEYKSPIYMPRKASRITLRVVSVRVERLQDISEEDAAAEGTPPIQVHPLVYDSHWHREEYRRRWNNINESRGYSWDSNPWVWVVEFERVEVSP